MKKLIHPSTAFTYIQRKDGSSYVKHWSYLRATLILEGDPKKWETNKYRHSVDIQKLSLASNIKSDKKASVYASFWYN